MADPPNPAPNLATLQALRTSLEGSLLRSPADPEPPELAALVALALSPSRKLREIDGAELIRANLEWVPGSAPRGLPALRTALSVLEKYGRNLLSPSPPRHWRTVRFGNPVFRSTVGAVQGGRAVLKLLGYTEESGEGLSFPPPPGGPDRARAAAVTADVIILRREIDLLTANQHPNPQFFTDILLGGAQALESDAIPEVLPAGWSCPSCTLWNEAATVLCRACDRPRLARRPQPCPSPSPAWPCPRCTFLNRGHAPSCDVCGAARDHAPIDDIITSLATPTPGAIPVTSGSGSSTSGSVPTTSGVETLTSGSAVSTSGIGFATSGSVPTASGVGTVTSGSAPTTSGVGVATSGCGSASPGLAQATSGSGPAPSGAGIVTSGCGPAPSRDALRQNKMLEDGRRLVGLVRAAEAQGLPPESLGPSPLATPTSGPAPSPEAQIRHFRRRLGKALQALLGAGPELSLAEAAWAWLEGEGRPEKARRVLIGRRKQQVHVLVSLGFPAQASAEALRQHQGSPAGALRELQRERLRPFRLRHFRGAEPGLDFRREDQQALVRQVLATLPVASWGRASLVASLGRELGLGLVACPSSEPLLGELVEAVGSCGDRAVLRRRLRCECAVCGWGLPRRLMQWLPGCSCPLCPECFRMHFTVGVRERGVGALGCPSCGRPDLRDDAQRLCYWSTLEPGLRRWLDPDTFGLVTRKLTELELLRDPQFLWCPHCSFGFIFEGERGPAQCPQCHQCCCPRCQLPWDPRHGALSCADFGAWLQSHNAPGPGPGLSAFLEEIGIVCPQCSHWFSLARGGCLHFRCSQCQHQFCAGCGETFQRPGSCPSPCSLRGSLHAHHPRDCLFYLRDWDLPRLQQLLLTGNIPFETEPPPEAPPNPSGGCPVPEQKEFGAHFRDEPCGRETAPGQAGLCRAHYSEYLVSLINRHGLDPAPLYDRAELLVAAERHLAAGRTRRLPGESEAEQEVRLRRLLEEEAPVRPRPSGAGPRPLCK